MGILVFFGVFDQKPQKWQKMQFFVAPEIWDLDGGVEIFKILSKMVKFSNCLPLPSMDQIFANKTQT